MRRFYWLLRSSPMVRYGARNGFAIGAFIGTVAGYALTHYFGGR